MEKIEPYSPLTKASALVNGARQHQYGPPEKSMAIVADFWSTFLGISITPEQVCSMMILLKLAREKHSHKFDNLIDMAGYVELMHRCVNAQPMGGKTNE